MEYHKGLLFILIAAEIIISANIAYVNYSGSTSCIIGSGCNIIQKSSYSTIFGISISLIGFIAFSLYFLIYLLTHHNKIKRNFFLISSIIGSIFAVYFIFLQLFVIKQICTSCMLIDFLMIFILVIAIYDYIQSKRI